MEFPDPVIEVAIEPKTKADQEKMGMALAKLAPEDPSFRVSTDQESGQTILKGMGELHLEIKVDILRRTYKVDANVGAPQVAYRETLDASRRDRVHAQEADRRLRPVRRVKIVFEPRAGARLRVRERRSSAARCRRNIIPGVEKGIKSAKETGLLAGFPVIDFKATLIDGEYHEVDFSVLAFEIAARAAFREALQKGGSELLEPIMKVEVVTPEEYTGRCDRRSQLPARPDPGPGHARQCAW